MLVETTLNYNQQQRESGAVSDTVQRQGTHTATDRRGQLSDVLGLVD